MSLAKNTIPVSKLVLRIKAYLQKNVHLESFWISGEISNIRNVNGHQYFDLKDAGGQISCTMWKTYASRLGFTPSNGMAVLCHGEINVYEKRGTLQLSVDKMQLDGIGALYEELERRKKALEAAGYFNPAHKKPRPEWIESIGIITGASTAALEDVKRTISNRWPMLSVTLYPASVQGENAPREIMRALRKADKGGHDALLLVRGGGSIEDLFCFNDVDLVKTIYDLNTYIVTGVGHEIDTTLVDYVSDQRAVTPTAAAQWVTPDQAEIRNALQAMENQLKVRMVQKLENQMQRFVNIQSNPWLLNPLKWAESKQKDYEQLVMEMNHRMEVFTQKNEQLFIQNKTRFEGAMNTYLVIKKNTLAAKKNRLLLENPKGLIRLCRQSLQNETRQLTESAKGLGNKRQKELESLRSLLEAMSPDSILSRGYSITYQNGKLLTSTSQAQKDASLEIRLKDGRILAQTKEIV